MTENWHPQQSTKCNLQKRLIVVGSYPNFWKIKELEISERCWRTFMKTTVKPLGLNRDLSSWNPTVCLRTSYLTLQHKTFQLLGLSNYVYVKKHRIRRMNLLKFHFYAKIGMKTMNKTRFGVGVFYNLGLPSWDWVWSHAVRYYSIHAVVMGC